MSIHEVKLIVGNPLPRDFYLAPTVEVAYNLLGCKLLVHNGNKVMSGVIVETEAYGPDDPSSHAHRGPTQRNAAMFGEPGDSYVYRIYGMYWCINVVTQAAGIGEAVLIRALEPVDGIETMQDLRKTDKTYNLCSGPGKICMAMGITGEHNGLKLCSGAIRIVSHRKYDDCEIVAAERIGISQASDYPWRFYVADSKYISKK